METGIQSPNLSQAKNVRERKLQIRRLSQSPEKQRHGIAKRRTLDLAAGMANIDAYLKLSHQPATEMNIVQSDGPNISLSTSEVELLKQKAQQTLRLSFSKQTLVGLTHGYHSDSEDADCDSDDENILKQARLAHRVAHFKGNIFTGSRCSPSPSESREWK